MLCGPPPSTIEYEFRLVGSEGVGYYKAEAEAEDAPDYNDFMATMKELGAVS